MNSLSTSSSSRGSMIFDSSAYPSDSLSKSSFQPFFRVHSMDTSSLISKSDKHSFYQKSYEPENQQFSIKYVKDGFFPLSSSGCADASGTSESNNITFTNSQLQEKLLSNADKPFSNYAEKSNRTIKPSLDFLSESISSTQTPTNYKPCERNRIEEKLLSSSNHLHLLCCLNNKKDFNSLSKEDGKLSAKQTISLPVENEESKGKTEKEIMTYKMFAEFGKALKETHSHIKEEKERSISNRMSITNNDQECLKEDSPIHQKPFQLSSDILDEEDIGYEQEEDLSTKSYSSLSSACSFSSTSTSHFALDPHLEQNLTKYEPCRNRLGEFCQDFDIKVDGSSFSRILTARQSDMTSKWRKEDAELTKEINFNSELLRSKLKCTDAENEAKGDDGSVKGSDYDDSEALPNVLNESRILSVERIKTKNTCNFSSFNVEWEKKRSTIVKRQIKEAVRFLKVFGVWVRKEWIRDEKESQMWNHAEEKYLNKLNNVKRKDELRNDSAVRNNLIGHESSNNSRMQEKRFEQLDTDETLEELKTKLKVGDFSSSAPGEKERLLMLIKRKEKKLLKREKESCMSNVEKLDAAIQKQIETHQNKGSLFGLFTFCRKSDDKQSCFRSDMKNELKGTEKRVNQHSLQDKEYLNEQSLLLSRMNQLISLEASSAKSSCSNITTHASSAERLLKAAELFQNKILRENLDLETSAPTAHHVINPSSVRCSESEIVKDSVLDPEEYLRRFADPILSITRRKKAAQKGNFGRFDD